MAQLLIKNIRENYLEIKRQYRSSGSEIFGLAQAPTYTEMTLWQLCLAHSKQAQQKWFVIEGVEKKLWKNENAAMLHRWLCTGLKTRNVVVWIPT